MIPYLIPVTVYKAVGENDEIFVQVPRSASAHQAIEAAEDFGIPVVYVRETNFQEVLEYWSKFMPQCSIAQLLLKVK
jgi:hypothetical protein